MSLNYTALSWTQLRKLAKDRGVKVSTKNSIIAQLKEQDTAIAKAKLEERIKAHQDTPHTSEIHKAPVFDYKRYLGFKLEQKLEHMPIEGAQMALACTIECHYKVKLDYNLSKDRGHYSKRIEKCLRAIDAGQVELRADEDIIARLNKYFPKEER